MIAHWITSKRSDFWYIGKCKKDVNSRIRYQLNQETTKREKKSLLSLHVSIFILKRFSWEFAYHKTPRREREGKHHVRRVHEQRVLMQEPVRRCSPRSRPTIASSTCFRIGNCCVVREIVGGKVVWSTTRYPHRTRASVPHISPHR